MIRQQYFAVITAHDGKGGRCTITACCNYTSPYYPSMSV